MLRKCALIARDKGAVYSTGKGDLFNFAAGGSYQNPQRVEGIFDVHISQVSCGEQHSIVLESKERKPFQVPWTLKPRPKTVRIVPEYASSKTGDIFKRKVKPTDVRDWDKIKFDDEPEEKPRDEQKCKNDCSRRSQFPTAIFANWDFSNWFNRTN